MKDKKQFKRAFIVSAVLPDRRLVETVLNPQTGSLEFVIYNNGKTTKIKSVADGKGRMLVPLSANNALIRNRLVSFPSEPIPYESIEKLVRRIQSFIHQYVDLSKDFETIASYYVLLTWVYEQFNEIPYLRKIGDYGSGKTRFLKVLGSICYKGVFAAGGTSTAALFHIIDKYKGTLIIDEADFVFSDEKSAIAKILNNGNASGFPILRVSVDRKGRFTPISYDVYCPKIIASRHNYHDQALESRFITETFRPVEIRKEIPITLPDDFEMQAQELRNQLLMFRFENYKRIKKYTFPEDMILEGRIKQIFASILAVVPNTEDREQILEIAVEYNQEMKHERSQNIEAQVLTIIKQLSKKNEILSIGNITAEFLKEYSDYYYKRITAKWIGFVIRNKLNLKTYKSHGIFVINPDSHHLLASLYERYSI